jgi:transposase-like protein
MYFRSPVMKKRVRRCDPQRQHYWEEVMRRWKEGGQSVRAYCCQEGLQESAFYFWRRELSRRRSPSDAASEPLPKAARTMPGLRLPGRSSRPRRSAALFLPVRVVEGCAAQVANGIEIVLSDGRVVRVQPRFDQQTLADVLAVLEQRPC